MKVEIILIRKIIQDKLDTINIFYYQSILYVSKIICILTICFYYNDFQANHFKNDCKNLLLSAILSKSKILFP